MRPRATLRLQFHAGFTLAEARAWVPYFHALGISHIYASPLQAAQPGSLHGYDGVDPTRINPELGGDAALRELVAALRARGMGLILDIVPNHLGVGRNNPWWWSVLEWGTASPYAEYFDIDWGAEGERRLLLPVLGQTYGATLQAGELKLKLDARAGRLSVAYYDQSFPLTPPSYGLLLEQCRDRALRVLAAAFRRTRRPGPAVHRAQQALAAALEAPARRKALQATLRSAQGREGRSRLDALLQSQHYRLAWWRTGYDELNWRRFFEVTSLAALRMDRPEVFEAVHRLVVDLYAQGLIDGVRVDHVDGLADPAAYCRQLRKSLRKAGRGRPRALRSEPYVVVEKILGSSEQLPQDWETDGTTGYDFMSEVSALLHDPGGEKPLQHRWASWSRRPSDFAEEVQAARRRMVEFNFATEVERLLDCLHALARSQLATRDYSRNMLRRALASLLVAFPVYRSYTRASAPAPDEDAYTAALRAARQELPAEWHEVLDAIGAWLRPVAQRDEPDLQRQARRLFQHLTPALAAKAVEDTAFYRYGVLLSRNEVGSDPTRFALAPEAFHQLCQRRVNQYPEALLATATHDHKRGEDLRMRLALLSELPEEWERQVTRWREQNAVHREGDIPAPGDEYQLYQMLVGAWPPDLRVHDGAGVRHLMERIAGWQEKALREAKLHSDWLAIDERYERGCRSFLERILADTGEESFRRSLITFVQRTESAGAVNSLAQTLLRLTCPGVPDLYQGCEFWDFSLVDPDNRRPVDFASRATALKEDAGHQDLLANWRDGRIKQWLIARALAARKRIPALFTAGDYQPLELRGSLANHGFAFARQHAGVTAIVVVPRLCARLVEQDRPVIAAERWGDTEVVLPGKLRGRRLEDVLGRRSVVARRRGLALGELLQELPVALLLAEDA